jgi:hypothetical protein
MKYKYYLRDTTSPRKLETLEGGGGEGGRGEGGGEGLLIRGTDIGLTN